MVWPWLERNDTFHFRGTGQREHLCLLVLQGMSLSSTSFRRDAASWSVSKLHTHQFERHMALYPGDDFVIGKAVEYLGNTDITYQTSWYRVFQNVRFAAEGKEATLDSQASPKRLVTIMKKFYLQPSPNERMFGKTIMVEADSSDMVRYRKLGVFVNICHCKLILKQTMGIRIVTLAFASPTKDSTTLIHLSVCQTHVWWLLE